MGFFSEIGDFLKDPVDYVGEQFGKFSYEAQKPTWDYQTSNSYQHTIQDLRNAGLNPMMAYMNGATSGATVGGSLSDAYNIAKDIGTGISSAGKLKVTRQQRELESSQIAKNEADIAEALSAKALNDATTAKTIEETKPTARKNRIMDSNKDLQNVEVGGHLMGDTGAALAVASNVIKNTAESAKDYFNKMQNFEKNFLNRSSSIDINSY